MNAAAADLQICVLQTVPSVTFGDAEREALTKRIQVKMHQQQPVIDQLFGVRLHTALNREAARSPCWNDSQGSEDKNSNGMLAMHGCAGSPVQAAVLRFGFCSQRLCVCACLVRSSSWPFMFQLHYSGHSSLLSYFRPYRQLLGHLPRIVLIQMLVVLPVSLSWPAGRWY